MTVETTTSKAGPYAGAGTVGPFPVPFRFLDASHLQVLRTDPNGGSATLTLGADYSVQGAGQITGAVTLTAALPSSFLLTVLRSVPATQEADYVPNDAFPAESHERALDKLTMLVQQQGEMQGRALTVPPTDPRVSLVLPPANARAKRYLSFDDLGRPIATTFDVDAVAQASQAAQDAAAAAKQSETNAADSAADAQGSADFAREQSEFVAKQVAATTPTVVRFSGDGVATSFELPSVPGAEENTLVYISGVYQQKNTYDIPAGTSSLIFSEAPPFGAENIEVVIAPSVMLSIADAQDMSFVGPDGVKRNVGAYLRDGVSKAVLSYDSLEKAADAANTLPDGQVVQSPDAAGVWSKWIVTDGTLVFAGFASPLAISIADAGATPGVDCASLLLSLFDKNVQILVPNGDYTATIADEAGVIKLWANLSKITTIGKLVVTLPTGKLALPAGAAVTSNLSGMSIKGQSPVPLAVNSVAGVTSGVFTAYDGFGALQTDWRYHQVAYALADASGVSVGDYVHIPWVSGDNSGTNGVLSHLGVHEVIAKSGNQITVLISSHYTPSTAFAAMEMQNIPTVLSFATAATFGVPGMVVANNGILGGNTPNDLGGLSDVVLVGKACAIDMPDGRGPAAFDAYGAGGHGGIVARDNARMMVGRNVGFSGWPSNSLSCARNSAMNSVYPVTSSMAGRNGFVCSGSSMELQNIIIGGRNYGTIATGSMNDGYENQDNGHMYCDNSWSVGNHRTGYSNTGNAYGNFQSGNAIGNRDGGVISDGSHCIFKPGTANYNTNYGLRAQNRALINAASAEARGNTTVGVFCSDSSEIQFGSGKSWENGPSGSRLDYRVLTGGRIEAVNSAVDGYTIASSPPLNIIGPNLSVVSTSASPVSLTFSAGTSAAMVLDSTNTALFGTNGVGYPSGRIKTGGNIVSGGTILHSADNAFPFGLPAYRATLVYAASGTINTSDGREKTEPLPINDAVMDAWGDVQIIVFQWLEAVAKKGVDTARWHFGVIAQQVREAFEARGLDATRYGLLCYDVWDDEYQPIMAERVNADGEAEEYDTGEKRLIIAAGNRWGIRADQCLFLEAAYQRRRADRIEARLDAAGI